MVERRLRGNWESNAMPCGGQCLVDEWTERGPSVTVCVACPCTRRGLCTTVSWDIHDICAYTVWTKSDTQRSCHGHRLITVGPSDCTAATSRYWRDSIPRRVHRIHHFTGDARPLTGLDILVQPTSDAHPNEIRFRLRFGVRNENYCESVAES